MILNKLDETRWGRALQVFAVVFSLLGCIVPWFFVCVTKHPIGESLLLAILMGVVCWGGLIGVGCLLFAMIYFPYMYIKDGPGKTGGTPG